VADLVPYRSFALPCSSALIQEIRETAIAANVAVAGLHEYATGLVKNTLEQAASMMPSHPTQTQMAAIQAETQAYLNQIEGIGYSKCQRILMVVEAIGQQPE